MEREPPKLPILGRAIVWVLHIHWSFPMSSGPHGPHLRRTAEVGSGRHLASGGPSCAGNEGSNANRGMSWMHCIIKKENDDDDDDIIWLTSQSGAV